MIVLEVYYKCLKEDILISFIAGIQLMKMENYVLIL